MLLVASAAAPASAEPGASPFLKAEDFSGDLQIVGSGLAWKDVHCLRDCVRFPFGQTVRARYLLKQPGQKVAELARTDLTTIPGGSNSVIENADFAASNTRALMVGRSERNVDDQLSTSATVFAGALGSRPAELFENPDSFELPFSLDGVLLAFDETRCVTGSTDVVVRSLADGSVRRVPMAGMRIEALALAGERLAVLSYEQPPAGTPGPPSGELAVWNLETLTKVASVPVGPSDAAPALALRPDGALTFVTFGEMARPEECHGTLWLLGPGALTPQTIANDTCNFADFAGDQVLGRHLRSLFAIPPGGGEHRLLNLGRVELRGATGDGTSVAYALRTCDGDARLYRVLVSAAAASAGAPPVPAADRKPTGARGPEAVLQGAHCLEARRRRLHGAAPPRRDDPRQAVRAPRRQEAGEAAPAEPADEPAAPAWEPPGGDQDRHHGTGRERAAPPPGGHPHALREAPRRAGCRSKPCVSVVCTEDWAEDRGWRVRAVGLGWPGACQTPHRACRPFRAGACVALARCGCCRGGVPRGQRADRVDGARVAASAVQSDVPVASPRLPGAGASVAYGGGAAKRARPARASRARQRACRLCGAGVVAGGGGWWPSARRCGSGSCGVTARVGGSCRC
jgi:hypothetical protein